MRKIAVFSASFLYAAYLFAIFSSDICYQKFLKAAPGHAMRYINFAITLNPAPSEYYYKKYCLLKDAAPVSEKLSLLATAISREPSHAYYHLLYGLELLKDPDGTDEEKHKTALGEIKKARDLKPFNQLYRDLYNEYAR